ncbi:hypothetical protein GCK72_014500 [Caenorhabditis remanei]|uniref:Uncharacterized protein n=1 Tax=Caenorhabditis remanei TaxID=31234 RepID=A0A6A5GUJ4_CAERE|nr:hypothetical protein GCK72_014500 [Caenorhabditis remanei]KAF1758042.1 hypothetical protein GCK72_014500 [Caenorhabditis remanei]
MDVVTLLTELEETKPTEKDYVCAVADDIIRMVDGKTKRVAIYVVFLENLILTEPFKLLYYNNNDRVTQLPGLFAKQKGFNMWQTRIMVLSEKAFGSYNAMKFRSEVISKNIAYCNIGPGYDCDSAKLMKLKCGHCFCIEQWAKWSNNKRTPCAICNTPDDGEIRLKLRHGPCPIDMCIQDQNPNQLTAGAVLIPCGCRIRCQKLEDVYNKYRSDIEPILKVLSICPYDACKKKVTDIKPIRMG